jgi:hypothetical protein
MHSKKIGAGVVRKNSRICRISGDLSVLISNESLRTMAPTTCPGPSPMAGDSPGGKAGQGTGHRAPDLRHTWRSMTNSLFAASSPSAKHSGGQCRRQTIQRQRKHREVVILD